MVAMLFSGLLLWGQVVWAQVVWTRTIDGQWVVNHLGTAIASFGAMTANKIQWTQQIQAARTRFFATVRDPVAHAKAEEEFAALLLEKDLYYIMLALTNPVRGGNSGPAFFEALDFLAGGKLDGGMGGTGMPFRALVRSLRSKLGATDNQMPVAIGVLVPGRYQQALAESLPEFLAHIADRNQHEISKYAMQNPGVIDQSHPMYEVKQRIVDFIPTDLAGQAAWPAFRETIQRANSAQNPPRILMCTYVNKQYAFWYATPPTNLSEFVKIDAENGSGLSRIGTDALLKCPANEAEVGRIESKNKQKWRDAILALPR